MMYIMMYGIQLEERDCHGNGRQVTFMTFENNAIVEHPRKI